MKIVGPPDGNGGGIRLINPPDGTLKMKSILPDITIIAAISKNYCIGKKNEIPWHIKDDFKHFKDTTTGHVVVPGRKTHESIIKRLGHPLPNRETVVLTHDYNYSSENCRIVHSEKTILAIARHKKVFIIGGAQIYSLFLPLVKRLIITHVNAVIEDCDAFFPKIGEGWNIRKLAEYKQNERNEFDFFITEYTR